MKTPEKRPNCHSQLATMSAAMARKKPCESGMTFSCPRVLKMLEASFDQAQSMEVITMRREACGDWSTAEIRLDLEPKWAELSGLSYGNTAYQATLRYQTI